MSKPSDGQGHSSGAAGGRDLSPEEKAQFERRLSDLGQRIDKVNAAPGTGRGGGAGGKGRDAEADAARSRALGLGFSIAAQLVAGVLIGGGMGYYLDRWLHSAPWFMVLFLGFGFAAGLMNVIRTAREMQKISEAQSKGAKSVPDDASDDN